ncbi:hypothetical protein pEpSNUABM08_57 [Erwinia phage pEp_SNUABM_08]|uniref:Uncharacterized protein n=1 Tax=Erwinia phage pEp_SNUABM_08 TaxID=2593268 RepID=A0A5J6DAA8_9CAUD|nr:hypothetical protein JT353_gp57 [Erwinia phage pEp_SNUABM_08]QEQ94804.1 hypothetical protein pEpSNUABM08_57 [Erwinia phage pEp_SNUABM_08]
MPKNKPLNFEGATLTFQGGTVSDGMYGRNFWRVTLADGTMFQRDQFGRTLNLFFQWERWWPNKDFRYYPDRRGSWRKLSMFDNAAVDSWVKAHPDYCKDGTKVHDDGQKTEAS